MPTTMPAATGAADRQPSLAASATERIRAAIACGDLKLGQSLSEEKLAVSLGMSRTPVREALTTLHAQGLVTILPQRGSFVFQPTEADVQELCEFRAMAESRALWLAHARDRDGTLDRMRQAQARMVEAHAAGDYRTSAAADAAFHDALLAGAGNRFLTEAYAIVSGRISAVRAMLLDPEDIWRFSATEHDEIIQAFAAADLLLAESALGLHIMRMRPRYRLTLEAAAAEVPASRRRRRVA
jgi:DNA-binding GntR family transcriptional regulator